MAKRELDFNAVDVDKEYDERAERLPPTQVWDDEEEPEEYDEEDAEMAAERDLHEMYSSPTMVGGSSRGRKSARDSVKAPGAPQKIAYQKRRIGVVGDYWEEETPDLDEYLAQWDITDATKIGLCRTYANYLAQRSRTSKIVKK